jgi:hypothetical protein
LSARTFLPSLAFAQRIAEATQTVFGESKLSRAVEDACQGYQRDVENIQAARGISALLIAIVGAKGQGKTWVARQFVRDEKVRSQLRSGDLIDDATTRLVWVGPVAPEHPDPSAEIYHPCSSSNLVQIGQPYVLLDTPGLTDTNQQAAKLAYEALALAPVKLFVVSRDQIRSAANLSIARQIDGAICIPVITSVEPEEMPTSNPTDEAGQRLLAAMQDDLRNLRDHLSIMAPTAVLAKEVLVPDFEITGDEEAAGEAFLASMLDQMHHFALNDGGLAASREQRLLAAKKRLQDEVAALIGSEMPQLSNAVSNLNREADRVPERVLESILGSTSVLETGIRMRLRARLVGDTSLLWFPYRTTMTTLHLTQGAWDRVMLALAGSVPSLFGALASWAKNVRQSRDFTSDIQDGIRRRTQEQVEERLSPLCDQFHREVLKLRPKAERASRHVAATGIRLTGVEELQTQSQEIFDAAIARNATRRWIVQIYALLGVLIFWSFMAGPIVLIYREYCGASLDVLRGVPAELESFPHPTASLILTSLLLSMLPLAIYCMLVLTWTLNRSRVGRVAEQIIKEHDEIIQQLKANRVIRLDFDDPLLSEAEFLLNLRSNAS